MAKTKYVDLTGLTYYDEKIKSHIDAKDAATLQSAKDYADDLGVNYDAAGSAKTVADDLATVKADVKTNTDALAIINGDDETTGSLQWYITMLGQEVQTMYDEQNATITALDTRVGTIPSTSTAKSVVAYVDEKTSGLATDGKISELTTRVTAAEGDIDTLQSDTSALATKVNTLIGDDSSKSVRTIANEELVKQLIPTTAKESLDTLSEIANWIQSHPDDASAMNTKITNLETKVGDIPSGATSTTVVAYADEAANDVKTWTTKQLQQFGTALDALGGLFGTDLTTPVDTRISNAVATETTARTDADTALGKRIDTLTTTVNGKASSSDLTALTTRVTTAEDEVDDLQAAIGTNGSVTNAIAAAKKSGDDAMTKATTNATNISSLQTNVTSHGTRITALETKVGDGFEAITTTEIDNLFTS